MLHRIILVLTLLVAVSCTGDDTVIERVSVFCPTLDRVLMEDETCPDPPPVVTTPPPPTTQDPDTDRGAPGRADCNIPVNRATTEANPFEGTTGNDTICGNERNDVIDGRTGDDIIFGGTGNDILIGGAGNFRDTLKGEAGNDTLRGDEGIDTLDGGAGTDTVDYCKEYYVNATPSNIMPTSSCTTPAGGTDPTFNGQAVEVDLPDEHAVDTYGDGDVLVGIENVKGTPADDTILGDGNANRIYGFAGDDTINGGGGTDVIDGGGQAGDMLDGGAGTDTLVVGGVTATDAVTVSWATENNGFENMQVREGVTGVATLTGDDKVNVITGGGGADVLAGAGGNDTLVGGGEADTLRGGLGANTLTGGAGGDCFEFTVESPIRTDTVTDFETGDTVRVAGTIPDSLKRSQTDTVDTTLSVEAKAGRLVIVETRDSDSEVLGERGHVANVRGLAEEDTAFAAGGC